MCRSQSGRYGLKGVVHIHEIYAFSDTTFHFTLLTLFSWTFAQRAPVNRFARTVAQMTRPDITKCLLWVLLPNYKVQIKTFNF